MVNGYFPQSLKEALEFRAMYDAVPYGGGTDLMINADPNADYLFLNKVPELKQISEDSQYIRIGVSCTFTELMDHPLTPAILKEAVSQIAAPAIRNFGTVGGNIGNGSAKADSALIFFVTDSVVRLMSSKGERLLPIKEFYVGRKQLALAPDELITELLIPKTALCSYYYKKVGARKAQAISRVCFAGLMDIADGKIIKCSTAFGAVSEVVLRLDDIDSMLAGKTIEEAKILKPAYLKAFEQAIVPITGRISAEYRKDVCMNLLKDFLDTFGI